MPLVWLLTLSRLGGHQQQVAVEAKQHEQAHVELSKGGALYEGLQGGGKRGQRQRLHLFTWKE